MVTSMFSRSARIMVLVETGRGLASVAVASGVSVIGSVPARTPWATVSVGLATSVLAIHVMLSALMPSGTASSGEVSIRN